MAAAESLHTLHASFSFSGHPLNPLNLFGLNLQRQRVNGRGSESGLQPSARRRLKTRPFPLGASAKLWFQLQAHEYFRGTGMVATLEAIPFPRLWSKFSGMARCSLPAKGVRCFWLPGLEQVLHFACVLAVFLVGSKMALVHTKFFCFFSVFFQCFFCFFSV